MRTAVAASRPHAERGAVIDSELYGDAGVPERSIITERTAGTRIHLAVDLAARVRVDRICPRGLRACPHHVHPSFLEQSEGQTMAQEKKGAGKPSVPAPSAPIARCLLELHPHARVPEPPVDSKRNAAARR